MIKMLNLTLRLFRGRSTRSGRSSVVAAKYLCNDYARKATFLRHSPAPTRLASPPLARLCCDHHQSNPRGKPMPKKYKVVELKMKSMFGGTMSADDLEDAINKYAEDGWGLDKIVSGETARFLGMGDKDVFLLIFCREE